ncbi:hypothetical protein CFC21_002839 [Triticum aestivum]|uniref:Uncharacterized protein n=2 Tax=Triticum TaxID=4564 RepID=A0A3B5Y2I2_WHEAT|nr:hypothetical protein CFC21_002839 [Triticum aestivum]
MCSRTIPLQFRARSANPVSNGTGDNYWMGSRGINSLRLSPIPTEPNRGALNAAVPNKAACCKFLPGVASVAPSSSPLRHVTRGEQRPWSSPVARTNDGAAEGEPEAPGEAEGKQGDEEVARRKSAAQEVFEGLYICGYVLFYRIGECVWYKVKEGIAKLRKKR